MTKRYSPPDMGWLSVMRKTDPIWNMKYCCCRHYLLSNEKELMKRVRDSEVYVFAQRKDSQLLILTQFCSSIIFIICHDKIT